MGLLQIKPAVRLQIVGHAHVHTIELDLPLLIDAAFCAGAAMITFGAVLGKVSPTQLTWLLTLEVCSILGPVSRWAPRECSCPTAFAPGPACINSKHSRQQPSAGHITTPCTHLCQPCSAAFCL